MFARAFELKDELNKLLGWVPASPKFPVLVQGGNQNYKVLVLQKLLEIQIIFAGGLLSGSHTLQKCFDPWHAGAGAPGICSGPVPDARTHPVARTVLFPGASAAGGRAGEDVGWFVFPCLQSIAPALPADLSPALLSAASEAGGVREAQD